MFSKRPNWPACSICGQQFSRHSLAIHKKQCVVKYYHDMERDDSGRYAELMRSAGKGKNGQTNAKITAELTNQLRSRKRHVWKSAGETSSSKKENQRKHSQMGGKMQKMDMKRSTITRNKRTTTRLKASSIPTNTATSRYEDEYDAHPLRTMDPEQLIRNLEGPQVMSHRTASRGGSAFSGDAAPPSQPISFRQCTYCQRTFFLNRIRKHESVCLERKGKRKRFVSVKQRIGRGNSRMLPTTRRHQSSYHTKTNWRQQHQEFIQAIREARIWQQQLDRKKANERQFSPYSNHTPLNRVDQPLRASRSGLTAAIPSRSVERSKLSSNRHRYGVSRVQPRRSAAKNVTGKIHKGSTIPRKSTSKSRTRGTASSSPSFAAQPTRR